MLQMNLNTEIILKKIGIPDKKIKLNKNNTIILSILYNNNVIDSVGEIKQMLSIDKLEMFIDVSNKLPNVFQQNFLISYIVIDKIKPFQLELAISYLKNSPGYVDMYKFENDIGLNVIITDEYIENILHDIITSNNIVDFKTGKSIIWKEINKKMPRVDKTKIIPIINKYFLVAKESHKRDYLISEDVFTKPELNTQKNSQLLEKHLNETNGQVITRFPPEPNGYLHIGHAKSMNLNFSNAKKYNGKCIMRFDDTNPETENEEYINSILEDVKWLGHDITQITFASDYFNQLYDYALKLIELGKAYVCHQRSEEVKFSRKNHIESPYRNRTIEENMKLFIDMKNGLFEEGKATLRMKMDNNSPNPCMWDLVAYRIMYTPHHRTKNEFCIYPTYDFTHCLCDTFENITHSLCTSEFIMRRESYNWLLDELDVYKAKVFEFARLQITNTVLSKRKLIKLVNENFVDSWNDPRMPTISGFRRRGFTPEGINNFCNDIGITTNTSSQQYEKLEQFVRIDLDKTSFRLLGVIDPIMVSLTNLGMNDFNVDCPNVPHNHIFGTRSVQFTNKFYIERSDFKEKDEKDYFGLALNNPNKIVKLKYTDLNIRLIGIVKNENKEIMELIVEHLPNVETKYAIHWVSATNNVNVEIRNYDKLFVNETPTVFGDDWIKDLNPNSKQIINAKIETSINNFKHFDRIQLERNGFYCVDPETTFDKIILNKTLNLKESNWKKSNK